MATDVALSPLNVSSDAGGVRTSGNALPKPVSPISSSGTDLENSVSGSASADSSYTATSFQSDLNAISGNKSDVDEWRSTHVSNWLSNIDLDNYIGIFQENGWDNGRELLKLKEKELLSESTTYFKNNDNMTSDQIRRDVRKILREIEKLQINEYDDIVDEILSVDDIFEFERRLAVFTKKWERIAWIQEYVEDWDGRKPTTEVLEEELDVPYTTATDLLSTYNARLKEEEIDLNKLFEGFDISEHGVIWWSIVLDKLQTQLQDSLWTVLRFVLRELSTKVCIRLLEHFKFELTKFESIEIDRLCQAIVFGSLFPMCTAVRLSGYMMDAAERDLSREKEFSGLANDYAKLGIHLLKEYTESDHLAAILLEMDSDIDGLSAIRLAVKYRVIAFVSDKRIERIANTLFRHWRFLRPQNRDESFKVRPLNIPEFYDLLKKRTFYFTPLGQFSTEITLFTTFLLLFTYVTQLQLTVYSTLTLPEIIFWILNIGYIAYEIWDAYSAIGGLRGYFSDWTNQLDSFICFNFLVMMGMRIYILWEFPYCNGTSVNIHVFENASCSGDADDTDEIIWDPVRWSYDDDNDETTYYNACSDGNPSTSSEKWWSTCLVSTCCKDAWINNIFSTLWVIAVIIIWMRVLQLFLINRQIGPFVNMIGNMMTNFLNWVYILIIFWFGAVFALVYIASGDVDQYRGAYYSIVTTFRAMLGEWPVDATAPYVGGTRDVLITITMIYWMTMGAIVLLNLLIALMAKTFDDLHQQNNSQVIFQSVKRIYALDNQISVMSPPLFLVVVLVLFILKIFDYALTVIIQYPLPISFLMPHWLKKEGKESNLSGTEQEMFSESTVNRELKERKFSGCCGRCKKAYFIHSSMNLQKFDWVCSFCRQRTILDYSKVLSQKELHISYSDLVSQKEIDELRQNSQNLDPVQRLGDRLGLDNEEVVNVRRLQPILCQRCYRHRKPITRTQLQLEFLSYWFFYFLVKPPLLLVAGLATAIVLGFRTDIKAAVSKSFDISKAIINEQMKCKYSADVLKVMPSSKEMTRLFSDKEIIWYLVNQSKFEITPRSVRRIVEREILKRAHDRDYELHQFYNKVCGKNRIVKSQKKINKKNGVFISGKSEWKKIEYSSKLWFKCILNNTRDSIHLSHTKLFPFSAKDIEAHIEATLNETVDDGKFKFDTFNEKHLTDFLPLLYIVNQKEQKNVIKSIRTFGNEDSKFISDKGKNASLWDHFLFFLYETRNLIARTRRIENMIRDVEDAAKAHGNDTEIYLSHFHLVFEDIQNDAVANVIFRSIDQENESVPYWKVRNFLIAMKQMRRNVDRELLEKSRYTQVSRVDFLDIVLRRVKARDDDSDDDDSSDDDRMRDDTDAMKEQIEGIRREADKIFTRIWKQNELKITLTQIREYRRKLPKDFNDIDSLKFIKQRLERYIKKNNIKKNNKFSKKNIAPLTIELFKKIMNVDKSEFLKYNQQQKMQKQSTGISGHVVIRKFALFDENDVPEIHNLNGVLRELKKIYSHSENVDRTELTVLDAHNLIFIGKLMYDRVNNEIKSRGHDLELTQELFVKTMEKKVYGDEKDIGDYSKAFENWSDVARQSASIFQQVHDEEQNKVTLGQVRETLRWIYNDLSTLMPISKFKKKLQEKKKIDQTKGQMVDHNRFWKFIVNELGVEDDKRIALTRLNKSNTSLTDVNNKNNKNNNENKYDDESDSSSDDDNIQRADTGEFAKIQNKNRTSKSGGTVSKKKKKKKYHGQKTDDFKRRKLTNYERSSRVFNLMENQNGLWITMRQIHVYIKWLTQKIQDLDIDWSLYVDNGDRIDERTFKTVILNAANKNNQTKLRQSVIDIGTIRDDNYKNMEEQIGLNKAGGDNDDVDVYEFDDEYDSDDDNNNRDDKKYDDNDNQSNTEDLASISELNRLRKFWRDGDLKLFSKQLSWIFRRCAIIDVATDTRASWYHICKFISGYRDGSIEKRVLHDLKFLTGNHQVYRDEFEQFKATLKCRSDAAISLFYQIRHFCASINWAQISEFIEFLEINLENVEDAIDLQPMGEDEDPTVEELIPLMKIASEVDGNWLFSIVIRRHSSKVSWVEIREYLIDWNETRDEVTEFFEELIEKRDRVKLTEKVLDGITNKLTKIKEYFDSNSISTKDELNKKTKHELIEYISRIQWTQNAKQGFNINNNISSSLNRPSHLIDNNSISIKVDKDKNKKSHQPRQSGAAKIFGQILKL